MNSNDDNNNDNCIHEAYIRALRGGNEEEKAHAKAAVTAHYRQSAERHRDFARNDGMERIRNHMQEVNIHAQSSNVLVGVLQVLAGHGHENSLADQLDLSTIYHLLRDAPLGGSNAVGEMEDGNRILHETRGYLQRNRDAMQNLDIFLQLSCTRQIENELRMGQLVVQYTGTRDVNANMARIGNANIGNLRQAIMDNRSHCEQLMNNFHENILTGDTEVLFEALHESDEIYFQFMEELFILTQPERVPLQNGGNPNDDNNNGGD